MKTINRKRAWIARLVGMCMLCHFAMNTILAEPILPHAEDPEEIITLLTGEQEEEGEESEVFAETEEQIMPEVSEPIAPDDSESASALIEEIGTTGEIVPFWEQPNTITITNHGASIYAGSSAGVYFYDYSTPFGNAYCIDSDSPPVPSGTSLPYSTLPDIPEDYRRALGYAVKYSAGKSRYTMQATFHMIENLLGYSTHWNPDWGNYENFDVAAAKTLARDAVAYRDAVNYEYPVISIEAKGTKWSSNQTFTIKITARNCDSWTIQLPAGLTASQQSGGNTEGTDIVLTIVNAAAYESSNKKITGLATLEYSPAEAIMFATYDASYQNYLIFQLEDSGRSSDPYSLVLPASEGTVTVYKVLDRLGVETPEAGVQFRIYRQSAESYDKAPESSRDSFTTDAKGKASSKSLPLGDYVLEQVNAPVGTIKAASRVVTLPISGEIKVTNQTSYGKVKIVKSMDRGSAAVEPGAEFDVFIATASSFAQAKQEEKDHIVTNAQGVAETKNLPYGTYKVRQTKGAEGTIFCEEFTVLVGQTNLETVEKHIINQVLKGKVSIEKTTSNPNGQEGERIPEEGAMFRIYAKSAGAFSAAPEYEREEMVTDRLGKAMSKSLPYGIYIVEQIPTQATKNTLIAQKWEVFIGKNADGTPEDNLVYHKEVYNAPYYQKLRVLKTDAETGRTILLQGAVFQVLDQNQETMQSKNGKTDYVSDENGVVDFDDIALSPGRYYIKEIKSPPGYIRNPLLTEIVISPEDPTEGLLSEGGDYVRVVEFSNMPQKLSLEIEKTGEQLAGVEVIPATDAAGKLMYDSQGNPLTRTSFVYEALPLAGVRFSVRVGDKDICDFPAEDGSPILKSIDTDRDGVPDTQLGAGTLIGYIETAIDTSTGTPRAIASWSDLPLDALSGEAHFVVEEVATPSGYLISREEIDFHFSCDGQKDAVILLEKSIVNLRRKHVLLLEKEKEQQIWNEELKDFESSFVPVPGILFGLYTQSDIESSKDGSLLVAADSLVDVLQTDEKGKAETAVNLPVGQYYVKEIVASADIWLDPEWVLDIELISEESLGEQAVVRHFLNEGEPIQNLLMAGSLMVFKEAGDTQLPMSGVVFTISDALGNVVDTLTTGEDGFAQSRILPVGEYTVCEIETLEGYKLADSQTVFIGKEVSSGERYSKDMLRFVNQKRAQIRIVKLSSDSEMPMEGVVFGIFRAEDDEEVLRIVTDALGEGAAYVDDGDCYIRELETLSGYSLLSHTIPVTARENEVYKFRLTNDPVIPEIPKTGEVSETSPWIYVGLMGSLLSGCALVLSYRKGKKRKGDDRSVDN